MFQLNADEKQEMVTNFDHLTKLKFFFSQPYAFTEHRALMLGNVLKSLRAVDVSLIVVRAFVQLREILSTHEELAFKLEELERKTSSHDQAIAGIIHSIRSLMKSPAESSNPIGFTAKIGKSKNE